ncbi:MULTISPECIES: cob(I)yrinic acid a,c-diamide adenosyltransferase [Bacillaceae]|uniref:Corrinoid adenosyltransferase n=1 Tax=Evansella alkalicola TaxID=745819 RepID=A0ABS6JZI8_9BACI|nr:MULTISPECIES: cob(I)yrinic acid a,c-diamide adenosyltransferase [Bacillaceae]MBU9723998.1 cob(I)yrinic acid a,c-diamide adenosyltransferase [Bacillus alkalicola]
MKIYTKKGDEGETQLVGKKVAKTHERVEAYGTIDELNSFIGVTISKISSKHSDIHNDLVKIQHELFDLGGDLANVTKKENWAVKEEYVKYLENRIDVYWNESPPLKKFILPGGVTGAAELHVCRTVARRSERKVLLIKDEYPIPPDALKYINRLSDYFFAAARAVNYREGGEDVLYERGSDVFK